MSKTLQLKNSSLEREEIRHELFSNGALATLPKAAIEELAQGAKLEHYKIPTLLNAAHQPVEMMRLVVYGHVELLGRNIEGDEVCIAALGAGSWITWLGCFDDTPSHYDFYTSTNTTVISLPTKHMRNVANRYPELYQIAIRAISYRFRLLMEWTTDSAMLKNEYRVAKLLLLLSKLNASHGEICPIFYTQDKLAHLLRYTRQTVNRSLKLLAEKNLIQLGYKRIDIVDSDRMEDFINSGDLHSEEQFEG
ncbi:Crp/Fnr family transcriptional regulator [Grimontia sp. AD028]|uniref:Crp/Fnr family transcriptional regulator n=1 Tax=Grimontia sp. AD028 TaxID=1581149 RepID=UPI0009E1F3FA|nr:Crp/Fnr family transcriptional regulator [Grimontia sp. AD028]